MSRRWVERKIGWMKFGSIALPVVVIVGLLHLILPVLKDEYDLRRFGSDQDTVRIDSGHFRLYTKYSEEYAEALAQGLERFYVGFLAGEGSRYGIEAGEERSVVYVFRDKDELERWSRREFHDPLTNNGGFYSPGKREIAIVAGGQVLEDDLLSGYHEAVHMAFDVHLSGLSPWASEGLAVYYGDAVAWDDGRPIWGTTPRSPVGVLLSAFESTDDGPVVGRLLRARSEDFSSEGNIFYYAGSYLLVHYLLRGEGGTLAEGFRQYLLSSPARGGGGDDPGRFYRAVGIDPEVMEEGWRRHWRRIRSGDRSPPR